MLKILTIFLFSIIFFISEDTFRTDLCACQYINFNCSGGCCVNGSWFWGTMNGYYRSCDCLTGSGWCSCSPACNCTSWTNQGCGGTGCTSVQYRQTRSCDPSGCSDTTRCLTDSCTSWANTTCGSGTCTSSQMRQTRSCTYGCEATSRCVNDSCGSWTNTTCGGGSCPGTQMQQTRSCSYSCLAQAQCINHIDCHTFVVPQCSGGTMTKIGDDILHTFTSSGTLNCSELPIDLSVQYLVVGGGAGAGGAGTGGGGGGGGAGRFQVGTTTLSATSYTITVGGGGAGGSSYSVRGGAGGTSSIGSLVSSTGGGGGGSYGTTAGLGGASGGGGGGGEGANTTCTRSSGGTGSAGNNGGTGCSNLGADRRGGGGGGGASQNGSNCSDPYQVSSLWGVAGGKGGNGSASSLSGTSLTYAAGGGGGVRDRHYGGAGGTGGGGAGRTIFEGAGLPGTNGRGSGGGGAGNGAGGNGGSGIVIVRYTEIVSLAPYAPGTPWVNGLNSPAVIENSSPTFSAIFTDADTGDYASKYHIQVNTNASFTGTVMWDSNFQSLSPVYNNERTPGIQYNGSALSSGVNYYWRIRFADSVNLAGNWSTCSDATCEFIINQNPTAPTNLLTQGQINPSYITTLTPNFSAIYNDPDTNDSAVMYQIQVNTNSGFTGTTMWDSDFLSMPDTAQGTRSPDLAYAGSTLDYGTTYYWRIRFVDAQEAVSPWSTESAFFTTNAAPTAPTNLLTNTVTNPTGVQTKNPIFSAIFNDSDVNYSSVYYEIQVNSNSSFTGNTLWSSGKASMLETTPGTRSPDITHGGMPLPPNGATYYWRIRFWDSGDAVSHWASAQFTMEPNQTPTAPTSLQVDGIVNNNRVNNLTPNFTAIYNDPNPGDFSSFYEIEVNTKEDFTGTVMWDTGKQYMMPINTGERTVQILYEGSELDLGFITYYWRIRFWDASDALSPWGNGEFKTSGSYTTFQDLQLGGLLFR